MVPKVPPTVGHAPPSSGGQPNAAGQAPSNGLNGQNDTRIERLRANGNDLFNKGEFSAAEKFYSKALSEHSVAGGSNSASYTSSLQLMVKLLTNRALCYHRLGLYQRSVQDCTKVLEYDKGHVKAMYRRSQSLVKIGGVTNLEAARTDLETSSQLGNLTSHSKLQEVNKLLQEAEQLKVRVKEESDVDEMEVDTDSRSAVSAASSSSEIPLVPPPPYQGKLIRVSFTSHDSSEAEAAMHPALLMSTPEAEHEHKMSRKDSIGSQPDDRMPRAQGLPPRSKQREGVSKLLAQCRDPAHKVPQEQLFVTLVQWSISSTASGGSTGGCT
ncbi:unnamed protein product [Chrysoparadoxa australica]